MNQAINIKDRALFILLSILLCISSFSIMVCTAETQTANAKVNTSSKGSPFQDKGSTTSGIDLESRPYGDSPNFGSPRENLIDVSTGIGMGIGKIEGCAISDKSTITVTTGIDALHDIKTCNACKKLKSKYSSGEIDELYSVDLKPGKLVKKDTGNSPSTEFQLCLDEEGNTYFSPVSKCEFVATIDIPVTDDVEKIDAYLCGEESLDTPETEKYISGVRINIPSSNDDYEFISHPFGVKYHKKAINIVETDDEDDGAEKGNSSWYSLLSLILVSAVMIATCKYLAFKCKADL